MFRCPILFQPSPHCVFTEDTVTLHFFGVTVNNSYTAYIDLYNNGLVSCALTNKMHYQGNTNEKIFALNRYDVHVEPLLHKTLGIIFSPKALEVTPYSVKCAKISTFNLKP